MLSTAGPIHTFEILKIVNLHLSLPNDKTDHFAEATKKKEGL